LSFSGHLQLNRLLWCGLALIVLLVTHRKFVFRPGGKTSRKNPAPALSPEPAVFRRVQAFVHSLRHNRQVFTSYLVTDLLTILKSIPFLLMGALWIVLLSIETYSALHGDPRLGANYARTGLLVSTILETLPLLALPLLLFYSSELTWKSKASNFILLEKATPVPAFPVLLSRTVTLGVLALAFIGAGIVLAILTQVLVHYPVSDPLLYLSLFYYAGWPFVLTGCCLLLLQRIISNRYAGLTVAGLFLMLTNTKLGTMAGITHPLLRFANPFSMLYGDMNGFGDYPTAFHWKMVFFTAITAALLMGIGFPGRRKRLLLAGCCAIALATGSYIFYRVDIQDPVMDGKELNDWKQQYESLFKSYAGIPQPAIITVTAQVDLYPKERNYTVQGEYLLENKHPRSIDSVLVYIPRESRLSSLDIEGAAPAGEIDRYGHCWYVCKQPMAAGEKRRMHYRFSSGWSVFHGHASFNSIIENGSFLRISRYFPQLGYQPDLEISSGIERSKRKMGAQPPLAPPDSLALPSPNDAFIDLALTVSTDGDQTVVGSGSLARQWSDKGRNFFHYISDRPMPFRFALSSARYRVKKAMYRQIPVEIYYDARHSVNVDKLIENAKQTLAYCESAFGAYPHRIARFAEISSFTEGFAATAYPDVVYMRENAGFYNDISQSSNQDVINQLAGHELSHQWWGAAVWAPAYQEGGWILTEMLANYTALMLYRKEHGTEAAMEIVRQHLDTYLASRSYSLERPLYRTDYNSPHLAYNKGLLAMYQLEELAGEEAVNRALAALFAAHAYPNDPPTSPDLLKALYDNTPASVHTAITELFMQVILWDAKLDTVRSVRAGNGYTLSVAATVHKKKDDGTGKTQEMPVEQNVDIQVAMADGKKLVRSCPVINGHIRENIRLAAKPLSVTIDPLYKLIDEDRANNEKPVDAVDF
jgi:ABC-2 type transport system permease protein